VGASSVLAEPPHGAGPTADHHHGIRRRLLVTEEWP
jgi:hypothetical protein